MVDKYPPLPQLRDVDLRLLRVFMAVVRNRGFSAAQSELNTNQSTISAQMSQLEHRLKMTLCHRGRSGFRLTPEGEHVYETAQKMFRAIEQFRRDIASTRGRLTGELHVGTVDAVVTNDNLALHETIARFGEIASDVELHVHVRSPQTLLRNLLEERIHVAIAPFTSVPASIRMEKLHTETQVLYCSRNHEFFWIPDADISDEMLANAPYAARNYLQNWSPPALPHFLTLAVTGDMEAMAMFILSGRYLGYLPRHYAQQWVRSGDIRPLFENELSYRSQFCIAAKNDEKNITALEFFNQFTKQTQDKRSVKNAS